MEQAFDLVRMVWLANYYFAHQNECQPIPSSSNPILVSRGVRHRNPFRPAVDGTSAIHEVASLKGEPFF
jgi:hypothetical protein